MTWNLYLTLPGRREVVVNTWSWLWSQGLSSSKVLSSQHVLSYDNLLCSPVILDTLYHGHSVLHWTLQYLRQSPSEEVRSGVESPLSSVAPWHGHSSVEQSPAEVRGEVVGDTGAASTLSCQTHLTRVSTKIFDVFLNPLETQHLVKQTNITAGLCTVQAEETKTRETIVNVDQDNVVFV